MEHIFNDIEEYMLSSHNISRYTKNHFFVKDSQMISTNKLNKKTHKPDEIMFIPFQKDKLFWSFYIILHGFESYEFIKNDSFKIEKAFKIQSIEKLRDIKDKLKEFKIKRNEIENELVNIDTISIKGLEALCLIYNVSMMYISGKKYYEFLFNTLEKENIKGVIIHTENNEYGIRHDINYEYISKIRDNNWKLESIHKRIRGLSAYTIKELQTIATKLEISIIDINIPTKKKNKKQLYEEILSKL